MSCRKNSTVIDRGSVPVYLNVYDLTQFNGYAYWLGLGAYHSGLQVYGVEYAFGAHEHPSSGIFEGEPKQSEGFRFRKTILVGATDMGPSAVQEVMEDMGKVYKGNSYDLITKNCNHFCNDACIRLTGNAIPRWVNRLARIGFLCNCVIPATLNSVKVRHHESEHKLDEGEEKKLACGCNEVPSPNSPPCWPASPHLCAPTRGRSRNRSKSRRTRSASLP